MVIRSIDSFDFLWPVLCCLYLLAELLQVGDDAVTQAAVHGVCNKVGRAHHPHCLFQRLTGGKGTGSIAGAELTRCVNDRRDQWGRRSSVKSAHQEVVGRHRLEVHLEGLTPLEVWLQFVHFEQIIWKNVGHKIIRIGFQCLSRSTWHLLKWIYGMEIINGSQRPNSRGIKVTHESDMNFVLLYYHLANDIHTLNKINI